MKTNFLLKKGEVKAVRVNKEQVITITCKNGGQLADLTFPTYHQGITLDNIRSLILKKGDLLYDVNEKPVLEVLSIKSGANTNILYPGCRRKVYQEVFNKEKDGCRELLASALNIPLAQLPSTINLFMDFKLDCKKYSFKVGVSRAKNGDWVKFRALEKCTIAVSACPCEDNACKTEGEIVVKVEGHDC